MPEQEQLDETEDGSETLETDPEESFEAFKEAEMDDNQLFRAWLRRNDEGKLVLYVECSEEIEEFYRTSSTGESDHWKNDDGEFHEFYKRTWDEYSDSDMARYFKNKNYTFGNSYVADGRVNVGILRTVGLSDGVEFEIPSSYSEDTMEESIKGLKEIVVEVYKEFIRPVNVRTSVTVQEM